MASGRVHADAARQGGQGMMGKRQAGALPVALSSTVISDGCRPIRDRAENRATETEAIPALAWLGGDDEAKADLRGNNRANSGGGRRERSR